MKYLVHIFWRWSVKYDFRERGERITDDNSIENIKAIVKGFIEDKAQRYCYDCGHLDAPLNPLVLRVDVIQMGEPAVYRNEEVLQNHVFREYEARMEGKVC